MPNSKNRILYCAFDISVFRFLKTLSLFILKVTQNSRMTCQTRRGLCNDTSYLKLKVSWKYFIDSILEALCEYLICGDITIAYFNNGNGAFIITNLLVLLVVEFGVSGLWVSSTFLSAAVSP